MTAGDPHADVLPAGEGPGTALTDLDALRLLHRRIAEGAPWITALLEAVAVWRAPAEEHNGRHYTYLIGGEAFDWLTLAERLADELGDAVTEEEREALLFQGRVPAEVGPWEFQRILGRAKYRAHLNFWYGVMVEEALLVAVEERLRKDRPTVGFRATLQDVAGVWEWVYGHSLVEMLALYFEATKQAPVDTMSQTEHREFTYWCFKYRVEKRDPAKVASDTRLGVNKLQQVYTRYGRHPMVL